MNDFYDIFRSNIRLAGKKRNEEPLTEISQNSRRTPTPFLTALWQLVLHPSYSQKDLV